MESELRRTRCNVQMLEAKEETLERSLNQLTSRLKNVISQRSEKERQWQEGLDRVDALKQTILQFKNIQDMVHRKKMFEMHLDKLLEQFDIYSKVCLIKNPVSTNIMATFVVPKYEELVRNCLDWKSPSFYTHHQGYKIRLGVRGHKIETDLLLLSLYAEPGEYDERLNWPALYNFQVEIINKRGGENMSFCTGWNCWYRPRHNMESLLFKKVGYFHQTYVLVECNNLTDYLDNNSVEIRVSESPLTEAKERSKVKQRVRDALKIKMPKKSFIAEVSSGEQPKLSGGIQNLDSERREPVGSSMAVSVRVCCDKALLEAGFKKESNAILNDQLDTSEVLMTRVWLAQYSRFIEACDYSETVFYAHTGGYCMKLGVEALDMSKFGTRRCLKLVLSAVPGKYDEQLKWPAKFDFHVKFVNPQGGDDIVIRTGLNHWDRPRDTVPLLFSLGKVQKAYYFINCGELENCVDGDSLEVRVSGTSRNWSEVGVTDSVRENEEVRATENRINSPLSSEKSTENLHSDANCLGPAVKYPRPMTESSVSRPLGKVCVPGQDSKLLEDILEEDVREMSEYDSEEQAAAEREEYKLREIEIVKAEEHEDEYSSCTIASFVLYKFRRFFRRMCERKSPAFYTHHRGYKLCLGLKACMSDEITSRTNIAKSKVLLLSLYALPGEYDADLYWPAQFYFQLKIINKYGYLDDIFSSHLTTWFRPEGNFESLEPWGDKERRNFIPVLFSELPTFVKNGALEVQVKVLLYQHEDTLPLLRKVQSETRAAEEEEKKENVGTVVGGDIRIADPVESEVGISNPKCLMPNFKEIVASSLEWKSHAIYTHNKGYKLYLLVKGYTVSSTVQFLMLEIIKVRGEFDDMLNWPVSYSMHVDIINKQGGENKSYLTGANTWKRYDEDTPVFFYWVGTNRILVDVNDLGEFVEDDTVEFLLRFEYVEMREANGLD